jgi:DNA-3-methyladenine glycosylase I
VKRETKPTESGIIRGSDRKSRCWWGADPDDYRRYHDYEWGHPVTEDIRLFEKICLEGFQAGLSWLTILRKRERFREVFCGFDFHQVARFTGSDVNQLLKDAGIIRHRGKIEATVNNAQRAVEMEATEGSIVDWVWEWAMLEPVRVDGGVPTQTPRSAAFAKELKHRGWKFFGPTTALAFMQSEGLTNDHDDGCFVHAACESERTAFLAGRTLRKFQ